MNVYVAEFIGTMLLIILGDGVVANVVLKGSKGHNSGWIVIATGWGFAVAVGVYCVGVVSGGHLNPAVTLALAAVGQFKWALVPGYILAQFAGAFVGAVLVWLAYLPHWEVTEDKGAKLGTFCTIPAIRRPPMNLITEIIGTAVLLIGVLAIPSVKNLDPESGFSTGFGPFLVGILVWSIGLSLGGPTGYAINSNCEAPASSDDDPTGIVTFGSLQNHVRHNSVPQDNEKHRPDEFRHINVHTPAVLG